MTRTALAAGLVLVLLGGTRPARAADDIFDPAVPPPRAVLGYDIGEHHTDYGSVIRYVEAVARAVPDRVKLVPLGASWERRPMMLLVVSSPANIARLDGIKADLTRLADPRGLADAEAEAIVRRAAAVTWNNFGIDGNESASVEAAMEMAYRLAAARGGELEAALTSVVAVLNVCHNPESRERFVTWYNAHQVGSTGTADPQALEHHGPWAMDTNHNHYQTDLNRDAAWATQVETRHVVAAFNEWRPVTFIDHHGETENFFFPPVALPVNPHIPAEQLRWLTDYGRAIAAASDRRGWSYFTGEVFDAFYPGYWDAYPLLRGATGFTFETTGGGSGGLRVERDDETVITLRDGVERHVEGGLAVLRMTAARREERLREYLRFRRSAIEEGRRGPTRSYALVPGTDPGRIADAAAVLMRHGIEVRRLPRDTSTSGARGYRGEGPRAVRLPAGTYVVSLEQPEGRLAQALLEPSLGQQPEFLAEERRKRERNLRRGREVAEESPGFYDVTAWALPLAYDLEAWRLRDAPGGELLTEAPAAPAGVAGGPARAAYLVDGRTLGSARLVLALLRGGFKVAVARRSFTTADREWPAGTFVIRSERNPPSLHERLPGLATDSGVLVTAVDSSWTEAGIDLGSPLLDSLRLPRIAVAAGEPTSESSYGEVWFLLEQRVNHPFTALRTASLAEADLGRYDVLVLPDGDEDEYLRTLGDAGVERLSNWVREGGVIVCLGRSARLAAHRRVRWTEARPIGPRRDDADDEADSPGDKDEREPEPDADDDEPLEADHGIGREQQRRTEETELTPGAILAAEVDPTHFLGYGLPRTLPVLVVSTDVFSATPTGTTAVRIAPSADLLSGFTWPEARLRLRGAAIAVDEPRRRGHVIILPESPLFRHFWRGTEKLVTNAILLAPVLD